MSKLESRSRAGCVATAGLVLCGLALLLPEPEEHRPFALAVGVWPGMETLTLAREGGVLPEGEVNFVELSWTSATMMAFENRVVDGAVVTLDEMLRLSAGGHRIKAVLVMGASTGGDAIVSRPEMALLEELKGRRVGVELRASGEFLLARALQTVGMEMSDVTTVPLNFAEAENAFENHELDAVVSREPARIRLTQGGARVLFDSQATPAPVYRVLVVREDLLNEREEVLQHLVKAHFAALPVLQTGTFNAAEMGAVLRRERLTPTQFTDALAGITLFSRQANEELLSDGPNGLAPVLQEMAAFMKLHGLLDDEDVWVGLLDPRLVKGGA